MIRGRPAKLPATVLGGGVTALSVARGLAAADIPVDVLDDRHSPARFSRAVRQFAAVGSESPQEEMLDLLRTKVGPSVLLAGSDEGVELIARHRGELEQLGHRPAEGDDRVLLKMLDKGETYELAGEHGIAAPRVLVLRAAADLEQAIAQVKFPCVLKPVHSHLFARKAGSGAKVEFIGAQGELRRRVTELHSLGVEMLVTEVIVGASDEFVSYYGYLDQSGQSLLTFTKRKLRQYPPGFGIGTYHETTLAPEVAAAGQRFLQAIGFRGLGNVEFKQDRSDGELKLIECNPRFTLSNELIRRSGVNLALFSYCRVAGLETPTVTPSRAGVTLWDPIRDAGAFLAYRRLGELSTLEWIASVARQQCFPAFRLDDPLPGLARATWMLRRTGKSTTARRTLRSTGYRGWNAAAGGDSQRSIPARQRERGHPRGLRSDSPRILAGPIERLAGSGRRGRSVAARLDLAAATGVGPLWRRARAEGQLSSLGEGARDRCYERIWTEAATECGGEIVEFAPGLFQLSRGGKRTRVYQQTLELDNPVTLQVALDKAVVHHLMLEAGLAVAERVEWTYGHPAPALSFLERANGPCVVKPAAGTGGGHGVIPGIETAAELMRARIHAATGGERLLIERQARGDVYRLLFLDGELLDVVMSVPANVTGDGRSTVEELIGRENARRVAAEGRAGLSLLGMNLDTVLTLRRAGVRLSSVLEPGRRLTIRTATNNNAAEDNQTWRGAVSEEVIAEARAAAEAAGLRLAGVDVITLDIAAPLAQTAGMITEVNGTPGLHHHYLVADAERATRVAVSILEYLLSGASPGARDLTPSV